MGGDPCAAMRVRRFTDRVRLRANAAVGRPAALASA
jgi:hypothetical protein